MYIFCFTPHWHYVTCYPVFQLRSAAGVNPAQNVTSTNPVSQTANGNHISPEAYRAKHEITIVVFCYIVDLGLCVYKAVVLS